MKLQGKHIIDASDLSVDELNLIIDLALEMKANTEKFSNLCKGKILATLFYEPSTRTRLSFESAMLRMGGAVIGFSDAETSSVKKGENIADTIRVLNNYAHIIVMRHPREGAPLLASQYSTIPVINGGDGGHQHPTQTLTDLLTIKYYKNDIKDIKIAICGDLLFGRSVHSLLKTLSRYPNTEFVLISPSELRIPYYLKNDIMKKHNVRILETTSLEEYMDYVNVLYMTRIQKERFFSEDEYIKLKGSYVLTPEKLKYARKDLLLMHPLPRVNEIDYEVDKDPRAKYFEQASLGVFARMALMALLLGRDY